MRLWKPRSRTEWNWRLIVLPLLIIPAMVWVNFVAPARVADGVAAIPSVDDVTAKAQSGATPLHGFTHGRAVTCYTHPKVTLCYMLKQPNTVIDR